MPDSSRFLSQGGWPFSLSRPAIRATNPIPTRSRRRARRGLPSRRARAHRTAAVTPEPQLVMTGVRDRRRLGEGLREASGDLSRPCSTIASNGRFSAPGMWPERTPGRGSAPRRRKRPAGRASTTCAVPLAAPSAHRPGGDRAGIQRALKPRGGRFLAGFGRAALGIQAGRPPSRMRTFSAPKMRNVHHARGAEKSPCRHRRRWCRSRRGQARRPS